MGSRSARIGYSVLCVGKCWLSTKTWLFRSEDEIQVRFTPAAEASPETNHPQVILACCSWVMLWRDEWGLWEGAAGQAVFAGRAPPCAQGSLHSPV